MKGKKKQGNPVLRALLLGAAFAALGVCALSMTACDFLDMYKDGNAEPGKAVYTGANDGVTYTLTITEKTSAKAAVYTPKADDSYTLKVGASLSNGTVSSVQTTGSTLKITLKPAAAATNTFTVTVSPGDKKITNVTGTVTFDAGGTKSGPGNLDNRDNENGYVSVTGVTLDLTTLNLKVEGKTPTLNATVAPGKASNKKIKWTTSNSGVATVNSGEVIAISAGSAVITVTTEDGGKTASCAVTVYDKDTTVLTGAVAIIMTDSSGAALKGSTPCTGDILKVDTTDLDGTGSIYYQWRRGTTDIGSSETYGVTTADKNSKITVTVTRTGYTGSVTSAPTAAVIDNSLPALDGTVTISGNLVVGQTLKTNTSKLGGSGTISYQWQRLYPTYSQSGGITTTRTNIGTNSSAYVLTEDELNKTITVTVTRTGNDGSVTSDPTDRVVPATQTHGDFNFTERDKKITITKYTGTSKTVDIPSKINEKPVICIGDWAFEEKQLTGVTIPDSVTDIGYRAFYNNKLTSIVIPSSVTDIAWEAFSENELASVTFTSPSKVVYIEGMAFYNNNLTSVDIPESVEEIYKEAFEKNPLITVKIGEAISYLDPLAFPNGFVTFYNTSGKQKGTYTYTYDTETEKWAWAKE